MEQTEKAYADEARRLMEAAERPLTPLAEKKHSAGAGDFAEPNRGGHFLNSWPLFDGTKDLWALHKAIIEAKRLGAPVIFAVGGHVIKTGCSPVLIDLAERGFITHIAMNGAAAVHDVEIALCGHTSENVENAMAEGDWGARETQEVFDVAVRRCRTANTGLGDELCQKFQEQFKRGGEFHSRSLIAMAPPLPFRITVHATLGADTVTMYEFDGAAWGVALHNDLGRLQIGMEGMHSKAGVWVNVGSAQLLPEVFIKRCAALIRNGADLSQIVTANMDMIRAYRPGENVLRRAPGQSPIELTGRHEIMLPLLRMAILEAES